MKKIALLIVIGLNALIFIDPVLAQDTLFNGRKNKIGFMTGIGIQYLGQLSGNDNHNIALKTTYYYQVTFYQLQYYHSISRKGTFGIDILAQPQYNSTKYKMYDDATNYLKGYEFGLNIGFLFRKNTLNNRLSFYILISSGPHYVSGTPHRQSSGFIFSNNLSAGVNLRLYKNLYADIRPGFRHISNGKLRFPNAGLNDLTLTGGFLVAF
jgi:Lipid A 3-O-deacylase (PagL)